MDEETAKAILEELQTQNKILGLSFPHPDDVDAWTGDSVTLTAGQDATITFSMDEGYEVIVDYLYCDYRAVTNYAWTLPGAAHVNNLVDYSKPQILRAPEKVVLKISNADTVSHTYNYYVKARAKRVRT